MTPSTPSRTTSASGGLDDAWIGEDQQREEQRDGQGPGQVVPRDNEQRQRLVGALWQIEDETELVDGDDVDVIVLLCCRQAWFGVRRRSDNGLPAVAGEVGLEPGCAVAGPDLVGIR